MAAPRAEPSTLSASRESRERWRLFGIASAVSALLALPVGVAVAMSWVELPWAEPVPAAATPEWVALPQLRATTTDGAVVKARVALDVDGVAARTTIQRRTQQVGLLLEVSVASRTRDEIRSADGIEALSQDMQRRLNRYLEAEGANVVRSVAIQDLVVNPQ
jgi:flagellar basal body-associated protein FliL